MSDQHLEVSRATMYRNVSTRHKLVSLIASQVGAAVRIRHYLKSAGIPPKPLHHRNVHVGVAVVLAFRVDTRGGDRRRSDVAGPVVAGIAL
jgi:hypothetical protein